jgi:hypothetical protein
MGGSSLAWGRNHLFRDFGNNNLLGEGVITGIYLALPSETSLKRVSNFIDNVVVSFIGETTAQRNWHLHCVVAILEIEVSADAGRNNLVTFQIPPSVFWKGKPIVASNVEPIIILVIAVIKVSVPVHCHIINES